MTKFGSHNGMPDEAYTDVMESICAMVDHARLFHSQAKAHNMPFDHFGTPSALQKDAEIQNSMLPFGLSPGDVDNIYRSLTTLATWNPGTAQPSQHFKSFGPISLPAKRKRESLKSLSPVASFDIGTERNILDSPESAHLVSTVENRQPVSSKTDPHGEDIKLRQRTESLNQRRLISKWLSPLHHEEMHNFNVSQRYRKTGVWLSTVPSFRNWRDTSQSSIFWLHGARMFDYTLAYSRKLTNFQVSRCWKIGSLVLSPIDTQNQNQCSSNFGNRSFVVDALSANTDVTVLYFYCQSKLFRNHMSILRSLLKQAYLRTDFKGTVEDFYLNHKSDRPCDGDESAIQSYYQLFLDIMPTSRTYIVLDGVDECTADGLEHLMHAWRFVSRHSRRLVKLFVSSRRTETVQALVGSEMYMQPHVNAQLSLDSSLGQIADLETYVDGQIEMVAKQWDMWQNPDENKVLRRAKSLLLERASGR
ncbi:MAG: hypothetical protein Q9167_004157 [Letrouitia subvulpina]